MERLGSIIIINQLSYILATIIYIYYGFVVNFVPYMKYFYTVPKICNLNKLIELTTQPVCFSLPLSLLNILIREGPN